MASRAQRTFSTAGKFSSKTAVGLLLAAAALVVAVGVAAHASTNAEADRAAQAARKILHAADTYAAGSAQAGCPTISELIESRTLDDADRTEDAWGNRFRIVCEGAAPRVVSAGPDGHLGTADDVRFTH